MKRRNKSIEAVREIHFREEKGITLVVLIITIIILLVLVTVSISLVMKGGIIDRAERGTQAYSEAEIEE